MASCRMTRRGFLRVSGMGLVAMAGGHGRSIVASEGRKRPNFLLITADDMNWDAPGCFGGKTAEITPNIDKLAAAGVRFNHGHITIAVCQPSRSVLMTGRYPHRNGAEGFQPINTAVTTLQEVLSEAGYLNGILGKVGHLAPRAKFMWDMAHDMGELGRGRDPRKYGAFAAEFFNRAKSEGRPFFLMANSHDPHRPYHGSEQEKRQWPDAETTVTKPSRVYRGDEVEVPGFLPDIPDVRKEIAQYYSSVRRCDDTVGAVMDALRRSGMLGETLVMFLSDNGMALPFAKTNCYLNSTRTPWIARWGGRIAPGTVDEGHFISGIDYMPTVLEAAGLPRPEGMDGSSFLSVLLGKTQSSRTTVFTQFHQTSGRNRYPMRCVQDRRFGYIFNPWSDGQRVFRNESQSGLSFRAMQAAAGGDKAIAARVKLFQYRVLEELYDLENDPDCLHNLIDEPKYADQARKMRAIMLDYMRKSEDPALSALVDIDSQEARRKFMAEQDARSGKKTPAARRNRRQSTAAAEADR